MDGWASYLEDSIQVLRRMRSEIHPGSIGGAVDAIVTSLLAGRTLLVCGNGGSAADAMHITGELIGRYLAERRALRVICLSDNPAVLTAWSNDYSYDSVFARQVEAYGEAGGVMLGLSTSGNSTNVIEAFLAARKIGMVTIALTGKGGGKLVSLSDHLLAVPESLTPLVQQAHTCLYHYICGAVERRLFG